IGHGNETLHGLGRGAHRAVEPREEIGDEPAPPPHADKRWARQAADRVARVPYLAVRPQLRRDLVRPKEIEQWNEPITDRPAWRILSLSRSHQTQVRVGAILPHQPRPDAC